MQLNDYNTLLAVIGGLGHSAITRLHKTIELLSVEDQLVSILLFLLLYLFILNHLYLVK